MPVEQLLDLILVHGDLGEDEPDEVGRSMSPVIRLEDREDNVAHVDDRAVDVAGQQQ